MKKYLVAGLLVWREAFMPEDMKTAPEVNIPAEFASAGKFNLACPPDVQEIYTKIWTDLLK